MIFDIISYSCPLLLASLGALFSEYAGILALFLEGLISFSGFQTFLFTTLTGSIIWGSILGLLSVLLITFIFSYVVEKTKANQFIAAIGLNLFFSSIISLLSSIFFKTRGVLTSPQFLFPINQVKIVSVIFTAIIIIATICFLIFTQQGIYFRITGASADVLEVKGVSPSVYRISAWTISSFYAFFAGCFLAMKISSYVPNLSSGKGWMALAAVFLGRKKVWKIVLFVLIFCAADYFGINIQNIFPNIPSSILLSLPYLTVLLLTAI